VQALIREIKALGLATILYYMVKQYLRGLPVSDETLALNVIGAVGPGGAFLTQGHTLRHFREVWYSQPHGIFGQIEEMEGDRRHVEAYGHYPGVDYAF